MAKAPRKEILLRIDPDIIKKLDKHLQSRPNPQSRHYWLVDTIERRVKALEREES